MGHQRMRLKGLLRLMGYSATASLSQYAFGFMPHRETLFCRSERYPLGGIA